VLSETIREFTDTQIETATYLKKSCYATKLFYQTMDKYKIYGKLNDAIYPLRGVSIDDKKNDENQKQIVEQRRPTNPQQFDLNAFEFLEKSYNGAESSSNLLENVEHDEDKIRKHFDFMFSKDKPRSMFYILKNNITFYRCCK
jgi:hypothetical protein